MSVETITTGNNGPVLAAVEATALVSETAVSTAKRIVSAGSPQPLRHRRGALLKSEGTRLPPGLSQVVEPSTRFS